MATGSAQPVCLVESDVEVSGRVIRRDQLKRVLICLRLGDALVRRFRLGRRGFDGQASQQSKDRNVSAAVFIIF
ncbi:hypothetical protein [Amycolatopsis regifaucium]|uniref:hypothetical protein n=1 Tax=Amycolatopsis regifaucium TaxID=546365 RepID=UPI00116034B6|nr:hypothetical protein [Amycolatopsis regifaucium]